MSCWELSLYWRFLPIMQFFIFPSSVAVGKFRLYTAIEGVANWIKQGLKRRILPKSVEIVSFNL